MLYGGIGVVLSVFPAIHVESIAAMRSQHVNQFALMTAALWVFRIAPLLLLGCALSWLVERAGRSHPAPARPHRDRGSRERCVRSPIPSVTHP